MLIEDYSPVIELSRDTVFDLASRYSARKYREKIYKLLESGHRKVYVDFDNVVSATHSFIDGQPNLFGELIAVNFTFDVDKRDLFLESVKFINANENIRVSIHKAILIRKMSMTNEWKE